MPRRKAATKAPKNQINRPDEVEEEGEHVNNNATHLSPANDVNPARHGSNAQSGKSTTQSRDNLRQEEHSTPASGIAAPVEAMGNEQSRETNARIRATSHALKHDKPPPTSVGKLKKISDKSNPPYQNPTRKLRPHTAVRPDVYDVGQSPEKVLPAKARGLENQPTQFSPLRRQQPARENERGQVVLVEGDRVEPDDSATEAALLPVPDGKEVDSLHSDGARTSPAPTDNVEKTAAVPKRKRGRPKKNAPGPPTASSKSISGAGVPSHETALPAEDEAHSAGRVDLRSSPNETRRDDATTGPPARNLRRRTTANHLPQKEKGAEPSAKLADLRRRRSGPTTADAEAGAEDPGDDDEEGIFVPEENEEDAQEKENAQEEEAPSLQRDVIQTNEIVLSSAESEPEGSSPVRQRKRKRNEPPMTQANTSRKRRRGGDEDADAENEGAADDEDADSVNEDTADNQADQPWLHGQWTSLESVFKTCKKIEEKITDEKIKLQDKQIKDLVKLCKEAKKRFTRLQNHSGPTKENVEPAPILSDINERIDGLRGRSDEHPTDFTDKNKCTGIYSHLIPQLVDLLRQAVTCYLAMDSSGTTEISTEHLRIIKRIIDWIHNMAWAVNKKSKPLFYSSLPREEFQNLYVLRDIQNNIAVPLRKISDVFKSRTPAPAPKHRDVPTSQTRRGKPSPPSRAGKPPQPPTLSNPQPPNQMVAPTRRTHARRGGLYAYLQTHPLTNPFLLAPRT